MATRETGMGFQGKTVVAFESRMAGEMRSLIIRYGGRPMIAPSMREVPLEQNPEVFRFGERLQAGAFHLVILLTGVGTRTMLEALDTRWPREQTIHALRRVPLVTRGPKPTAVLREIGLQPAIAVPEPNTWRDILTALKDRDLDGQTVAVQEYGLSNQPLLEALRARGAVVERVPVYRWALPEDLGPLTDAIDAIINREVDVALFTNAVQVDHLVQIAKRRGNADALRQAFARVMIASIGPIASARLRDHGLLVDYEPSHAKMGILVKEASAQADRILRGKRRGTSEGDGGRHEGGRIADA